MYSRRKSHQNDENLYLCVCKNADRIIKNYASEESNKHQYGGVTVQLVIFYNIAFTIEKTLFLR